MEIQPYIFHLLLGYLNSTSNTVQMWKYSNIIQRLYECEHKNASNIFPKGDEKFSKNVIKSLNPLGIDVLFSEYHKHGYQTMFQEDLCWYDFWGIMLTDLERLPVPKTISEFKAR